MRTLLAIGACTLTVVMASLTWAQPGAGPKDKIDGSWVRVKKDDGMPRIEISREGEDKWFIQAWGDCEPDDCDWGKVPLHILSDSVASRDFGYGFATWEQGFKVTHMVVRIEKGNLVAESYNIFTDNSGRSNFRSVSKMKRAKPRP